MGGKTQFEVGATPQRKKKHGGWDRRKNRPVCPHCNKRCKNKRGLDQHLREVHGK